MSNDTGELAIDANVIIIGAGISGLTAAYKLTKKDPSLRILILEAKGRVGGRTLTVPVRTCEQQTDQFDLGAEWVSSAQSHILELLKELNIHTYPQYGKGCKFGLAGSMLFQKYDSDFPMFGSYWSCFELEQFLQKMRKLSKEVTLFDPMNCKLSEELDSMTVETLIRNHLTSKTSQDIVRLLIRSTFGCEASQLSALYFLAFSNGTGGMRKQLSTGVRGARELRIKGGAQQISLLLSVKIGKDNIILNSPVTEIKQLENQISVTVDSGKVYRCEYVIMAVPPSEVQRIQFIPSLPHKHRELLQRFPKGHLMKFVITYRKPFWIEKGQSGEILCYGGNKLDEFCPITAVYDATSYQGHAAIVGYIAGSCGVHWSHKDSGRRKQNILESLARCWGSWVHDNVSYIEKDWGEEPYTGGCPTHAASPGTMPWFHHIRLPHGRVYWAGAETAVQWCGYMDGAVQAGERAAVEILFELRPQTLTPEDLKVMDLRSKSSLLISQPSQSEPQPHVYRWTVCLPLFLMGMLWSAYTLRKHFWVIGVGRIA